MAKPSPPAMTALHDAPTLVTARVVLRAWTEADLVPHAAMLADPEIAKYLTFDGRPMDAAAAWRALAVLVGHWAIRGFGLFAIEDRVTGAFLGRAGPWRPEGWPGLEIGWALVRSAWGRGYATEAAATAGLWSFQRLGAAELISLIHVDNIRSQNVATRLGARPSAPTLHVGQPHVIWKAAAVDWPCPPGA